MTDHHTDKDVTARLDALESRVADLEAQERARQEEILRAMKLRLPELIKTVNQDVRPRGSL